MLGLTSSTLSDVIEHEEIVDLPLNGREFTQLALLTPGASAVGRAAIRIHSCSGAGGISPAVSGQRPTRTNFTIDGVLNNDIYTNVWSISPPPDAIESSTYKRTLRMRVPPTHLKQLEHQPCHAVWNQPVPW